MNSYNSYTYYTSFWHVTLIANEFIDTRGVFFNKLYELLCNVKWFPFHLYLRGISFIIIIEKDFTHISSKPLWMPLKTMLLELAVWLMYLISFDATTTKHLTWKKWNYYLKNRSILILVFLDKESEFLIPKIRLWTPATNTDSRWMGYQNWYKK